MPILLKISTSLRLHKKENCRGLSVRNIKKFKIKFYPSSSIGK
jgi:hypothetical protein